MARLSREESREKTREELLVAARGAFARLGYGGASIDLIAEAAGFSKGAFYSNFDSKEAIFLELLAAHMQGELAASGAGLLGGLSADAVIDQIADRYASDQRDVEWCLLSIEFALHAARTPAFADRYASLYGGHYRAVGELISKVATLAGRRVDDPVRAAALFVAFRQGLALDRSGERSQLSADDVKEALRRFMHGLLA